MEYEADGTKHPALGVPLPLGKDLAYPVNQNSVTRHVLSLVLSRATWMT